MAGADGDVLNDPIAKIFEEFDKHLKSQPELEPEKKLTQQKNFCLMVAALLGAADPDPEELLKKSSKCPDGAQTIKNIESIDLDEFKDNLGARPVDPARLEILEKFMFPDGCDEAQEEVTTFKKKLKETCGGKEFQKGKAFKQNYKEFLKEIGLEKDFKAALSAEYNTSPYRLGALMENFSFLDEESINLVLSGPSGAGKTYNSTNSNALKNIARLTQDDKNLTTSKYAFRIDGGADREASSVRKELINSFKAIYGKGAMFNLSNKKGEAIDVPQPKKKGRKLKKDIASLYKELLTTESEQKSFVVHLVDVNPNNVKKLSSIGKFKQVKIDAEESINQGRVRSVSEGKKEGSDKSRKLAGYNARSADFVGENNVVMVTVREVDGKFKWCQFKAEDLEDFRNNYDEKCSEWQEWVTAKENFALVNLRFESVNSGKEFYEPEPKQPELFCKSMSRAEWLSLEKVEAFASESEAIDKLNQDLKKIRKEETAVNPIEIKVKVGFVAKTMNLFKKKGLEDKLSEIKLTDGNTVELLNKPLVENARFHKDIYILDKYENTKARIDTVEDKNDGITMTFNSGSQEYLNPILGSIKSDYKFTATIELGDLAGIDGTELTDAQKESLDFIRDSVTKLEGMSVEVANINEVRDKLSKLSGDDNVRSRPENTSSVKSTTTAKDVLPPPQTRASPPPPPPAPVNNNRPVK